MSSRRHRPENAVYLPPTDGNEEEDGLTDIRDQCGAPFPVLFKEEVKCYKLLKNKNFHYSHSIDWDLMRELGIQDKVKHFISLLGLLKYAEGTWRGYDKLTLEFLTSMEFTDNRRALTCRLMETPFKVTYAVMNAVLGFGTSSTTDKPTPYNAKPHWKTLTGFDNWNTKGAATGCLKDISLVICHKFISYNVFGKEQANKVNSTELFMLHCAATGKKMCPTALVWHQFDEMRAHSNANPGLSSLITALAEHFGVLAPNERPASFSVIEDKPIDFAELRYGNFVTDARRLAPQSARRAAQATLQSAREPGPSIASPDSADMEVEFPEDDPTAPLTRADLNAFQEHFDTSMGLLFTRMDAHDRRLAALESSCTQWSSSFQGTPPPPDNH